jgi:hypothetical protein
LLAALPAAFAVVSCARVETESKVDVRPIEVKPIHITVDVNVRVDRELDNFFSFEDQSTTKSATQPATAPAAPVPPASTRTTTQTGA